MKKSIHLVLIGLVLLSGVGAGTIPPMDTSTENHRPEAPTITGPTSVKVGNGYTWSFNSTDPDGDNITYYIDWGDVCGGAEWHGPYPPGLAIEMDHIYRAENILLINSMAVDEHGAESNMTYFEVNISKSVSLDGIVLRLFERFPTIFLVLRHLFEEETSSFFLSLS
jgi:hypothetical protein